MTRKPKDIEKQLIEAIKASGMTPCTIARLAGIDRASLSRLLAGGRSLTLPTAAAVAKVLGLELRRVEG